MLSSFEDAVKRFCNHYNKPPFPMNYDYKKMLEHFRKHPDELEEFIEWEANR